MGRISIVYLRQSEPVTVDDLRITTRVPSPTHADVTVTAVVTNRMARPAQATVSVVLDTRTAQQDVALAANETKVVTFAPPQVASFAIDTPPLWWPVGPGSQELPTLM